MDFLEHLIEIFQDCFKPDITQCSPANDPLDPLGPPNTNSESEKKPSRFSLWNREKAKPETDGDLSTDPGDLQYLKDCSQGFHAINRNNPNRTTKFSRFVTIGHNEKGEATAVKATTDVPFSNQTLTAFRQCIGFPLSKLLPQKDVSEAASSNAERSVQDTDNSKS